MIKKSELRKAISLRLKKVRESLSFNQERMSIHFGLTRPSYTRTENGDTFPNHLSLYILAVTFDISLDWLICGKGPMFFKEKPGEEEQMETREGTQVEEPLSTAHRELLGQMEQIPLLHHEVMAFFHRFLLENKELVENAMKRENPAESLES
ncbi:MAG: helix-turn-helix transcriptional regulator [Candidatus Aminicenantes bacterium]|nr:MAG: helix-turn-helix transcriptional regulator [Candidatus Aminicenantes bacterium]